MLFGSSDVGPIALALDIALACAHREPFCEPIDSAIGVPITTAHVHVQADIGHSEANYSAFSFADNVAHVVAVVFAVVVAVIVAVVVAFGSAFFRSHHRVDARVYGLLHVVRHHRRMRG